jgi:hypothetical protein
MDFSDTRDKESRTLLQLTEVKNVAFTGTKFNGTARTAKSA